MLRYWDGITVPGAAVDLKFAAEVQSFHVGLQQEALKPSYGLS